MKMFDGLLFSDFNVIQLAGRREYLLFITNINKL